MWSNEFGLFPLFLLGGIVGSLTLALFCKWLVPHNRFLQFIGQNTVVILAVHEPIKRVVLKVSEVFTGRIGINISTDYMQHKIPVSLLVVLVVVLISLVGVQVFRLIKKKLPENFRNNFLAFVR